MKSIEIRTTQNVTITYTLADAKDRVLAFILDSIVKIFVMFLLWMLFLILIGNEDVFDALLYFQLIVLVPINVFYSLVSEYFMNGQTLGKKLLKIKVIKLNGKQPEFYDYLIRWVFRIIDIGISGGAIGVIMVASTEYAQRLGDMVSNCTVVKIHGKAPISLADILKIETRTNYEPAYPQIINFRKEDIILIKNSIDRYNKFRNKAHKKALILLSQNISKKLGIEEPQQDRIKFLKTLIKDYIVLTR
jgi:uncharacterized RDD family membrane protein YckC